MGNNKIVFFFFGNLNSSPRVIKAVESLLEKGFYIKLIIREFNSGGRGSQYEFKSKTNLELDYKKIELSYFPILKTFYELITNIYLGIKIRKFSYDLVFCSDQRTWLAGFIAKKNGIKLIFDSPELIPENVGGWRKIYWHFYTIILVRKANTIIHAEENRAKYFENKYSPRSSMTIHNYPFYIPNNKTTRKSNGIIKLVYSGLILKNRYYEELIEVVGKLPNNIHLDIWGYAHDMQYLAELFELKKKFNVNNVEFKGEYSQKIIDKILINYDIGLVFYKNTNLNQYYCAPNKIYEYILNSLPVITSKSPSTQNIIEEKKIGVCVEKINKENLISAIVEIIENNYRNNIDEKCKYSFSWEYEKEKFVKLFKN